MRWIQREIKCKNCQKDFLPKSSKNIFCCRNCFKEDFAKRIKEQEEKFPIWTCSKCGNKTELTFDPTIENMRWLNFSCPFCTEYEINLTEYASVKDEPIN